jgi:hypothetical protein
LGVNHRRYLPVRDVDPAPDLMSLVWESRSD